MPNNESGDLITRQYANFRGVDFTGEDVSLFRSPDALNMWKNYRNLGKCIETRPDIELFKSLNNSVYGIFFYTISTVKHMIIHCGVGLFDYNMSTGQQTTIKAQGMNPRRSEMFIYNNILYIKDGINYLEYDGANCNEVVGTIPITSISRAPSGGGQKYQDVNLLTPYRKNSFCADGTSNKYYLDTTGISSSNVTAWINGVQTSAFTVNAANGTVTFTTAPAKPDTDGQDNVVIQFYKEISGYRNRINKCTLLCVFDNRVFFSGNQDYPNTIFHSSLDDPRYVSDLDFYNEGLDMAKVKAMIPGNNALWVLKEPSQGNTAIFYHNPTIDSEYGKVYPSTHSNISTGCVATGINFNDDIIFFSDRGMEGINGDITTEQVVAHRSSLVDSKLLKESNYKNMILQEWEGYLLVIIGNKVYLADSNAMFTNDTHNEYEWFYWELSKSITYATVDEGILYLGTSNGIYTLTKTNTSINSHWTTCEDNFKNPNMRKTTNKKGCVVDMDGEKITISAKIDDGNFEEIGTYENTKGYIVSRIKKKKWKDIQLKFSSNKHFALRSCTLESFVGSYVKR